MPYSYGDKYTLEELAEYDRLDSIRNQQEALRVAAQKALVDQHNALNDALKDSPAAMAPLVAHMTLLADTANKISCQLEAVFKNINL